MHGKGNASCGDFSGKRNHADFRLRTSFAQPGKEGLGKFYPAVRLQHSHFPQADCRKAGIIVADYGRQRILRESAIPAVKPNSGVRIQ